MKINKNKDHRVQWWENKSLDTIDKNVTAGGLEWKLYTKDWCRQTACYNTCLKYW